MATGKPNIRALLNQLQNNLVCSESQQYFLADSSLDAILSLPAIEKAVQEITCSPDDRIGLPGEICRNSRKIFAILILMQEEGAIVRFRNHNVVDSRLPLSESDFAAISVDFAASFVREFQWKLLPFHFPDSMWLHHWEIDERRILPILESTPIAVGGFADVSEVAILPSQQEFSARTGEIRIVRKTLRSRGAAKEFAQEKMCLRLINQIHHPNIIQLLGSYSYRGFHNVLFPSISMNLREFLRRTDRFGKFQRDFTFFSALRGLSSALSHTHQLHLNQAEHGVDFKAIGYHHDLRPPNVLVSEETFILADFGLGNLKRDDDPSQTPWKPTSGDYLAPECRDYKLKAQDVTRAIDVWAFGCLIAEVATFIVKGSTGVQDFSNYRLAPGRREGWEDTGFFAVNGEVKEQVREWLAELPGDRPESWLISKLAHLSLQALTDLARRPRISALYHGLTMLSLQAHYGAAEREISNKLMAYQTTSAPYANNNIWFLQQRLRAWGEVLGLGDQGRDPPPDGLDAIHDQAKPILLDLFSQVNADRKESHGEDGGGAHPAKDESDLHFHEQHLEHLVEQLWANLPVHLQARAKDIWHQAILATNDKATLDNIQQALKVRYTVYDVSSVMAMMKRVQVEMLQPDSFDGGPDVSTIDAGDVKSLGSPGEHEFGTYEGDTPVLVERVRCVSTKPGVNPVQRNLVMKLKARSLSIRPKPRGLRTLDCVGVFKDSQDEFGYGFAYRFPEGTGSAKPTTLLQRLPSKRDDLDNPPLLGDKFLLAFALADFLKELHTIGWMHENFNPHNILFFPPDESASNRRPLSSGDLDRLYIVGLHKSRPDGTFWQTEGPDTAESLQDYQHPDHARTGRYRLPFDYYGLGIILLEIGLWRSFGSLCSKFRKLGLAGMRIELQKISRARLGPKMGACYQDVVMRCLDGSLDIAASEARREDVPRESPHRIAALRRFTEQVVNPLERLARVGI